MLIQVYIYIYIDTTYFKHTAMRTIEFIWKPNLSVSDDRITKYNCYLLFYARETSV